MIYITADHHFGHANIIKHCDRPFDTVAEMDECLADNWNGVVGPNDTVYHLGDLVCYSNRRPKLNGNITLVWGNHDKAASRRLARDVVQYLEIVIGGREIVLFHYPIFSWRGKNHGSIHLYGHSHRHQVLMGCRAFNVGVDNWSYTPMAIEEAVGQALANEHGAHLLTEEE